MGYNMDIFLTKKRRSISLLHFHSFTALMNLFKVHYFHVALICCGSAGHPVVAFAVLELV